MCLSDACAIVLRVRDRVLVSSKGDDTSTVGGINIAGAHIYWKIETNDSRDEKDK